MRHLPARYRLCDVIRLAAVDADNDGRLLWHSVPTAVDFQPAAVGDHWFIPELSSSILRAPSASRHFHAKRAVYSRSRARTSFRRRAQRHPKRSLSKLRDARLRNAAKLLRPGGSAADRAQAP